MGNMDLVIVINEWKVIFVRGAEYDMQSQAIKGAIDTYLTGLTPEEAADNLGLIKSINVYETIFG